MTAYYEEHRLRPARRGCSGSTPTAWPSLSLLPEQLKSEIEVVKEERRLRIDNDIAGKLDEQLYATAFLASPYRWPVIGWMGDLERINARRAASSYFQTYYAPNNCILVLIGDFDTKTALAQITKRFGSIPAQTPPVAPVELRARAERRAPGRGALSGGERHLPDGLQGAGGQRHATPTCST